MNFKSCSVTFFSVILLFLSNSSSAGPVEDADEMVKKLQGNYTVLFGMLDNMPDLINKITEIPPAVEFAKLKTAEIQKTLLECLDSSAEKVKDAKIAAVNTLTAAEKFKDRTAMKNLNEVQVSMDNAKIMFKSCQPKTWQAVETAHKEANEETKKFVKSKFDVIDNLNKLLKGDLPYKVETLNKQLADAKVFTTKKISELEVKMKNPLAKAGDKTKWSGEIEKLRAKDKEINEVASQIANDIKGVPDNIKKMLEDAKANIQKGWKAQ
jgi:cytochrome c556